MFCIFDITAYDQIFQLVSICLVTYCYDHLAASFPCLVRSILPSSHDLPITLCKVVIEAITSFFNGGTNDLCPSCSAQAVGCGHFEITSSHSITLVEQKFSLGWTHRNERWTELTCDQWFVISRQGKISASYDQRDWLVFRWTLLQSTSSTENSIAIGSKVTLPKRGEQSNRLRLK